VPLHTSFRTLPGILRAVDQVFADPERQAAVLEEDIIHDTARDEAGGTVTIWPWIQEQDPVADGDTWPFEVNKGFQSAPRQVAERMAGEIRRWIESGRPLGPRGRPVRADDILILVQMRGALFREIIRALHREGLPTPGADRLEVTSHIGVLDLMALGDVVLNANDDLQLAALLRSPLFDLSEDDLYAVAAHRGDASLWAALRDSDLLPARSAYSELHAWRSKLDFDRPFEFYAHVLYGEGGLQRFHKRFGNEVDDVFAEFLDLALEHEQSEQPSLQGFLAAMRSRDVSIGRELSERGGGVRVMTVHGAKGLEAPIVILADTTAKPAGSQLRSVVHIDVKDHLFIHASKQDTHVDSTDPYRVAYEEAQKAEYWRKLYVAMTRAEDELYVTGTLTRARKPEDQLKETWYDAIGQTLRPESEVVTDADGHETAIVFPLDRPRFEVPKGADTKTISIAPLELPALPKRRPVEIVRPSTAREPADVEHVLETYAEAAVDAETARKSGIALHALLQHLGKVPRADWDAVALKALAALAPDIEDRHPDLVRKAIAILTREDLAHLFGPNSRAEVPFLANATRNGEKIRLAGRIDRLVVEPGKVRVVDFKSDAAAPAGPEGIPASYRTQLSLYAMVASQLFPGHEVEAAILWTGPESLMNLPSALLPEARAGFTMD
jgi:ATP-dependent helicase/nuclease subunit A